MESRGRLLVTLLAILPVALIGLGLAGLVFLWCCPETLVGDADAKSTLSDFLDAASAGEWEEARGLLSNRDQLAASTLDERGWPLRLFYATGCESPWTYKVVSGEEQGPEARYEVEIEWRNCMLAAEPQLTSRLSFRLTREVTPVRFFAGPLTRWRDLDKWVLELGLPALLPSPSLPPTRGALTVDKSMVHSWMENDGFIILALRNTGTQAITAANVRLRCEGEPGATFDRALPAILPVPDSFPCLQPGGRLLPGATRGVWLIVHGVPPACHDKLSLEADDVWLEPSPNTP